VVTVKLDVEGGDNAFASTVGFGVPYSFAGTVALDMHLEAKDGAPVVRVESNAVDTSITVSLLGSAPADLAAALSAGAVAGAIVGAVVLGIVGFFTGGVAGAIAGVIGGAALGSFAGGFAGVIMAVLVLGGLSIVASLGAAAAIDISQRGVARRADALPILADSVKLDDLVVQGEMPFEETHSIEFRGHTPQGDWALDLESNRDQLPPLGGGGVMRDAFTRASEGRRDVVAARGLLTRDRGAQLFDLGHQPLWRALNLTQADIRDKADAPGAVDAARSLVDVLTDFISELPDELIPSAEIDPAKLGEHLGKQVRALGVRTSARRIALLIVWPVGASLRCIYRRYAQDVPHVRLLHSQSTEAKTVDWEQREFIDVPVDLSGLSLAGSDRFGGGAGIVSIPVDVGIRISSMRTRGSARAVRRLLRLPLRHTWVVVAPDGDRSTLADGSQEIDVGAKVVFTWNSDNPEVVQYLTEKKSGRFTLEVTIEELFVRDPGTPLTVTDSLEISFSNRDVSFWGLDEVSRWIDVSAIGIGRREPELKPGKFPDGGDIDPPRTDDIPGKGGGFTDPLPDGLGWRDKFGSGTPPGDPRELGLLRLVKTARGLPDETLGSPAGRRWLKRSAELINALPTLPDTDPKTDPTKPFKREGKRDPLSQGAPNAKTGRSQGPAEGRKEEKNKPKS
jgi:hypothetical protein